LSPAGALVSPATPTTGRISAVDTAKVLLVVDDDPDVLEILRLSLTAQPDWTVTTATGGAAAMARLRTDVPDGAVVDVEMPGVDGRAVLAVLRAEHPDVPVVFLTANYDPALAAELRALGARAVLHKPFDPIRIPELLAGALGWAMP
jgi:CheY-like chemotaxis protein